MKTPQIAERARLTDADIAVGTIYWANVYVGHKVEPAEVEVIGSEEPGLHSARSYIVRKVATGRKLRFQFSASGLRLCPYDIPGCRPADRCDHCGALASR